MKTVIDILYIIINFAWAACVGILVGLLIRDNWRFKHCSTSKIRGKGCTGK